MKNILITGGTGFIGSHLVERFPHSLHPTHKELDLTDSVRVRDYLTATKPDQIIHCGSNDKDICLYDNLRMFHNLSESRIPMIAFCTGREIEDRSYKNGEYVLSKYLVKELAQWKYRHINIIQIWGCFGAREKSIRFFAGNCANIRAGKPILVMEDRLFSYVYVKDLVNIIERVLEGRPDRVTGVVGYTMLFSEYAEILKRVTGSSSPIIVEGENMLHSYVGKNTIAFNYTPLEEALKEYYENIYR